MILENLTLGLRDRLKEATKIYKISKLEAFSAVAITFVFVMFSWIFFRANSMGDAVYIVGHLSTTVTYWHLDFSIWNMFFSASLIGVMTFFEVLQGEERSIVEYLANKPIWVRWAIYYAAIFLVLLFGVTDNGNQFIYFQF